MPHQVASAPESDVSAPGRAPRPWLPPAVISVIAFLLFAGTLRFHFVYDDQLQILSNPAVTSWSALPANLFRHLWAFNSSLPANYWRPLFLVWLVLNHTLFGFQAWGWHLAAVLCHVGVTLLVYRMVLNLTADRSVAATAALLFGVHPAVIETAAWVSGATDSLMALFLLPAYMAYLRWRGKQDRGALLASLAFFTAALLVKETAIVLPLLVLLHAFAAGNGEHQFRRAWNSVLPYAGVGLAYLIARMAVLRSFSQAQNYASWPSLVMTCPALLWFYLRMLFWPAGVSPYYSSSMVTEFSLSGVLLPTLALLTVACCLIAWIVSLRRKPSSGALSNQAEVVVAGVGWLIFPILPVLYLRALPPDDFAHVRYLYLPCIGFSMLVALGLSHLRFGPQLFGMPAAKALVSATIILALGLSTTSQQIWWANNLLLSRRGVDIAPQNPRALTSLGVELGSRGEYEQAIPYFEAALKINPGFWFANYNLGFDYLSLGRYRDALPYLQRAAEPGFPGSQQFGYLAVAQWNLGQLAPAEANIREALRRDPNGPNYHYVLGMILADEGRTAEAQEQLRAERALNPKHAGAAEKLR